MPLTGLFALSLRSGRSLLGRTPGLPVTMPSNWCRVKINNGTINDFVSGLTWE